MSLKLYTKGCYLGDFLIAEKTQDGWKLFTAPTFDTYGDAERYVKDQGKGSEAMVVSVCGQFQKVSTYHEVHPLNE